MSVQVEMLEKSMAKLTIEVPAEDLEKALQSAYNKQKKSIQLPGFRKGKAPRAMVEKLYGAEIFFDEAANILIPEAYAKAYDESGLDITSTPEVDIVQMKKGEPFIFTAEVAVKPEVQLGEYKGLAVDGYSVEVSDEEVDAKINEEAAKNAREVSVTRPVQKDDEVILDFVGTIDGEAFDGGRGENYPLKVGSNTFIPGFEDQLIGAEVETELDVNVTFPEDYQVPELQGKPAVFKCTIHEIKAKELPEIDDEFAAEVSEFDTLAEYKDSVKGLLAAEKERAGKNTQMDQCVEAAIANATVEIPEAMINTQVRQMYDNFMQQLSAQGLNPDQYFQFTGSNQSALFEQMKPEAEGQIKQRLVLEAIAKAENIEVSDERVEAELKSMAEAYGMDLETVKQYMGGSDLDGMKKDIAVQDAVELLVANAVTKAE